jgi:hypothetical protein
MLVDPKVDWILPVVMGQMMAFGSATGICTSILSTWRRLVTMNRREYNNNTSF